MSTATYTSNETERLGLQGRKVVGLFMRHGEEALTFLVEGDDGIEPVTWVTDADCCSSTFFTDIVRTHELIGHTVQSVVAEELGDKVEGDTRSRDEYDSCAVFHIVTETGMCDIHWRNSSNGYYGGSVGLGATIDGAEGYGIDQNWSLAA